MRLAVGLAMLSRLVAAQHVESNVEVYFSPGGNCTAVITNCLNRATNSILVQAYSFTSAPIAGVLVAAHRRGVKVQVILDRSQRTANYSSADYLAHAGIPVLIDAKHPIAHSKVMVIDSITVITGSFNFTRAAEKNAENLLVIRDLVTAASYSSNWHQHSFHSEQYIRGR